MNDTELHEIIDYLHTTSLKLRKYHERLSVHSSGKALVFSILIGCLITFIEGVRIDLERIMEE